MVSYRYLQQVMLIFVCLFSCCSNADFISNKANSAQINSVKAQHVLASLEQKVSEHQLTPGREFSYFLLIKAKDEVQLSIQPKKLNWQNFQLIAVETATPTWQKNHWQHQYTIRLAAPIAGNYLLPSIAITAFDQNHSQQLITEEVEITVVSNFKPSKAESASLQQIEIYQPPSTAAKRLLNKEQSFLVTILVFIAIVALAIFIIKKRVPKKAQTHKQSTL
ncbi:hypothetical protein [Thalassotalea sp. PLHSN55]|uniref:hypothetical protein n=1 Tax=Thalassotalea sp. PLHSN55 TaxID=3435888 RepID=UPI003F844581